MDNLSPASSTDISSLIGALELDDHLTSHGEGALERAADITMAGAPTGQQWTGLCCGRFPA
jgi:hypothetical protein